MTPTKGNVVWALMACYQQKHGLSFPKQGFDTLYDLARHYKVKRYLTGAQVNLAYRLLPDEVFDSPKVSSLPLDYRGQDDPLVGEISISNGMLIVPYALFEGRNGEFQEMFYQTPTIPGKDAVKVPLSWVSIDNLEEMGLKMPESVLAWRNSFLRGKLPDLDLSPLQRTLMHHQPYAVQCITAQSGRCLLADDMGLGKTTEAAAWLALHPESLPAVIVCPSILKINWQRELEAVFGKNKLHIEIIDGRPTSKKVPEADVIILNYDIMGHAALPKGKKTADGPTHMVSRKNKQVKVRTGWGRFLSASKRFKTVIFDEGHYIKNADSSRTEACLGFARTCMFILWLSGTPLEQRPIELWTAINTLVPGMFSSKEEFGRAFCAGKKDRFNRWDFTGSSYSSALNDWLLRTIMVRRHKKDVLKDLPDKTKCITVLPMSKAGEAEYRRAETDFIRWYTKIKGNAAAERANKAEHLAKMTALKQLAWKAKATGVYEWLDSFLESGEKIVIFYEFTQTGADLAAYCRERKIKFVQIDGKTPKGKRQPAVDAFQEDPDVKVFLGQIVACGTGLTLTAASNTLTVNYMWNPSKHNQAEDRCWRIGQKNAVSSWYLPVEGSVEEDIMEMLGSKSNVVAQVLDGEDEDPTPVLNVVTKLMFNRHKGR